MGDGNSFPLVVCVFQVILAHESIVLCMCSGNVLLDITYPISTLPEHLHSTIPNIHMDGGMCCNIKQ